MENWPPSFSWGNPNQRSIQTLAKVTQAGFSAAGIVLTFPTLSSNCQSSFQPIRTFPVAKKSSPLPFSPWLSPCGDKGHCCLCKDNGLSLKFVESLLFCEVLYLCYPVGSFQHYTLGVFIHEEERVTDLLPGPVAASPSSPGWVPVL